jgi:hypothetical protein
MRRLLLLIAAGAAACVSTPAADGTCTLDPTVEATCTAGADGGTAGALGLAGYSCTGAARPDQGATYVQGVPQGLICANQSAQTYCCTKATTPCAYDPTAVCDPGLYAYECLDINRPESYNPAIHCGQGVKGSRTVDFCCSGAPLPTGCGENDGLGCSGGLVGWTCPTGSIPKGQDLLANKSRADQYYLLCSIGTPAPNPKYVNYCCYPPAVVPPGGSCVEDLQVPGCAPGRFGFACYGPENPEADYPPIRCPERGVPGVSSSGYAATIYCCDFE